MGVKFGRALAAAALAGAVLAAPGCRKQQVKKGGLREIRVTVENLTRRVFRDTIPVEGTVIPVEFATLSAKIGGTLEML